MAWPEGFASNTPEYAGAVYHVLNRGDRHEAIFEDDADRERFLETWAEVCLKTGWQAHAYCLMANHFHSARSFWNRCMQWRVRITLVKK